MIAIVSDQTLEDLAAVVGQVADVPLRPRESSYYGDPYYSGSPVSDLRLTLNEDPMYRPGDAPEDRIFVNVPEARFVLWDADPEEEFAKALPARGLDARVVPQT